ncbi:MotA/TolQ/ExbB proton channel family protein [Ostreiculturibacter nitratireducens]|uniref:MotA/TolQ/ExbB proton channel family protein n=1 Tax=Ostreiculturibacter nitratireducens TaxID=3075226 RepID=UPI0031B59613
MTGNLGGLVTAGGPIIWILALLSLVSVALMATKAFQLLSARSGRTQREEAFGRWSRGERDAALALLAKGRSPADRVVSFAAKGTLTNIARRPLETELERRGNAEVEVMGRYLRLLELVAMISPLLGLLGTVLGMIQSFQELALAEGAANASVLAGGIWQALLTTAAGLVVAIPAAIGATLLSARVDGAAHDIESAVKQFFLVEDTGTSAAEE